MRTLFLPPQFSCQEKTRRAAILAALIWTNSLMGILSLLGTMLTQPEIRPAAVTNLAILAFLAVALFAIARRGWVTAAAWTLIGIDVGVTTIRALHAGGIRSPGVMLFFVFVLMAGLVLGEMAGFATAAACALIGLGLVLAEQHHMLPAQTLHYNSFTYWWISCFYMSLVVYLLRLALQDVNRALTRAETELADRRRAEQHLRIALEAASVGIWDGDLTSPRFRVDARAAATIGVRRGDDGRVDFADWRKLVHPDDLPSVTSAIEEIVRQQPLRKVEYRVVWPDGQVRHIEATSAPIADAAGKVVSHAGTVIDITERKLAEAEREDNRRKRRSLEHQLLQAQKREAVGTLASGIAHDFNNLLGAIRGFSDLLQDDLEQGSQARRFAERISATCNRGKDIVNQILTFARTGAQPQADVALDAVLRECEAMLTGTIAARAALHFSYPPHPIHVTGNAGQIVRLVTNLCVNAAEAFGERGGAIAVLLEAPSADDIAGVARGWQRPFSHGIGRIDASIPYARIHVRDNGGGIAPEVLRQIFDPFFTTKGRQRGSGLGLSVCQGIVESHGGFCHVETEPGRGTSFHVYLPMIAAAIAAPPEKTASAPDVRGAERILVVEDEPDIADWLTIGLERLGYTVRAFNDPLEAMSEFRKLPAAWDIVISDQIMPRMLGTEFLEIIRHLNPRVLTMLCSGHGEEEALRGTRAAALYLPKPVKLDELAGRIRAALGSRAAV